MHSHVVVGLGYGDEGKGSWVDHLCRKHAINTVVRFNGGAQALHHVTTESGMVHGFRQFGSHSFIPGAKTMLSRYMLIEPMHLMFEVEDLVKKGVSAPLRRLYISADAPIIPFTNVLLNQVMESARGSARHGSCGLGIGLTQRDIDEGNKPVIRAGDLTNRSKVALRLQEHLELTIAEVRQWDVVADSRPYRYLCENFESVLYKYVDVYTELAQCAQVVPDSAFVSTLRRQPVVFEGAQGAMLDQQHGTFPYCTRSTTTAANAERLLADAGFEGEATRHGLLRAYATRHGAGPFVTESAELTVTPCDNVNGEWQGAFRTGWFDAVAARSALSFSPVDELVVTNLDRLDGQRELKVATAYEACSSRYYDAGKRQLRLMHSYADSAERSQALVQTVPVYQTLSGYANERDSSHEAYLQFLEAELGRPIVGISRRKDHFKMYRPSMHMAEV